MADRLHLLRIVLDRLEEAPLLDETVGRELFAQLRSDVELAGAHSDDIAWLTEQVVRWVIETDRIPTRERQHKHIDIIAEVFTRRDISLKVEDGKVTTVRVL